MPAWVCLWALGAALGFAFSAAARAEGPELPAYRLGDIVRADLITPTALSVPATVRPEPPAPEVFRICAESEDQAVASFRSAWAEYRLRFQTNVTRATRGRPLDARALEHPTFAGFLAWYRNWNPEFPLDARLAGVWAMGSSDEPIRREWESALRGNGRQPIRADGASSAGPSSWIRLVPVATRTNVVDLPTLHRRARLVDTMTIPTLTQARAQFVANASGADKAVATFLSRFLGANCFPDPALTQLATPRPAPGEPPVRYRPGDTVVRAGQTVDARVLAALTALGAGSPVPGTRGTDAAAPAARSLWSRAWQMPFTHPWLGPVMVLGVLGGAGVIVKRRRSRLPRMSYIGRSAAYTLTPATGRAAVLLPLRSPGPTAGKPSAETRLGRG